MLYLFYYIDISSKKALGGFAVGQIVRRLEDSHRFEYQRPGFRTIPRHVGDVPNRVLCDIYEFVLQGK